MNVRYKSTKVRALFENGTVPDERAVLQPRNARERPIDQTEMLKEVVHFQL